MINLKKAKLFCKEDFSLIENYSLAVNDNTQTWNIHHRLEIDENKSLKQLKDEGRYYKCPASELIFLTKSEHIRIHMKSKLPWNKGKKTGPLDEETKQKISEKLKGRTPWNKCKSSWNKDVPCREETKCKLREKNKGKPSPTKGKHKVYDNKELNIYHFEY